MEIIEKAVKMLEQPLCNNCLGRQFGQLGSGYTNEERGRFIRAIVAMGIDQEKYKGPVDLSNFSGMKFHYLLEKIPKAKNCFICNNFFKSIDKIVEKAVKLSNRYEFRTFLVGTQLPFELLKTEEDLWERVGIDYCEQLKAEINREVGRRLEKLLNKKADLKKPDVVFLVDADKKSVKVSLNPLFVYGEYQKLKRGIPQTKWPSGKYKTSVEQIIAKPFMAVTKGDGHKLHGMGREDIDARCLAWRPFVLEILNPENRSLKLKAIMKKVRGPVHIRNLHFSDINEVRKIKESRSEKTYRVNVATEKAVSRKELSKLSALVGILNQRTPERVAHRRADRFRKRAVKSLKWRRLGPKNILLVVRCEAGLYVKELVSGDNGRTKPSVAALLGVKCTPKNLDVIKIYY